MTGWDARDRKDQGQSSIPSLETAGAGVKGGSEWLNAGQLTQQVMRDGPVPGPVASGGPVERGRVHPGAFRLSHPARVGTSETGLPSVRYLRDRQQLCLTGRLDIERPGKGNDSEKEIQSVLCHVAVLSAAGTGPYSYPPATRSAHHPVVRR